MNIKRTLAVALIVVVCLMLGVVNPAHAQIQEPTHISNDLAIYLMNQQIELLYNFAPQDRTEGEESWLTYDSDTDHCEGCLVIYDLHRYAHYYGLTYEESQQAGLKVILLRDNTGHGYIIHVWQDQQDIVSMTTEYNHPEVFSIDTIK